MEQQLFNQGFDKALSWTYIGLMLKNRLTGSPTQIKNSLTIIFSASFFIFAASVWRQESCEKLSKKADMNLQQKVTEAIKAAMKAKDKETLEALRAIKAAWLLTQTEAGVKENGDGDASLKLLQKLVKQRKDSAALYSEQGRDDLAQTEIAQAAVISRFLPEQINDEDLRAALSDIIAEIGASSPREMGKVMAMASKKLAGRAEGKKIAEMVKELLS